MVKQKELIAKTSIELILAKDGVDPSPAGQEEQVKIKQGLTSFSITHDYISNFFQILGDFVHIFLHDFRVFLEPEHSGIPIICVGVLTLWSKELGMVNRKSGRGKAKEIGGFENAYQILPDLGS